MFFLILLFFIDLVAFNLFKHFFIQTVLNYFLINLIKLPQKITFYNKFKLTLIFLFLILEDLILNQRVGLSLIYLIPLTIFILKIRHHLILVTSIIVFSFSLLFSIFMQIFLIKAFILGQNITIYSTFIDFFVNLIIGYLVLLGIWGNRTDM